MKLQHALESQQGLEFSRGITNASSRFVDIIIRTVSFGAPGTRFLPIGPPIYGDARKVIAYHGLLSSLSEKHYGLLLELSLHSSILKVFLPGDVIQDADDQFQRHGNRLNFVGYQNVKTRRLVS